MNTKPNEKIVIFFFSGVEPNKKKCHSLCHFFFIITVEPVRHGPGHRVLKLKKKNLLFFFQDPKKLKGKYANEAKLENFRFFYHEKT